MAGDWLSLEAAVEPLAWGRSVYTILRLPPSVVVFRWAGKSLLDRIGNLPGEVVEIRLRPAPPDAMETPDDVTAALLHSGLTEAWQALTAGKRRGLLYQIETAKRPDIRARRIAALMLEMGS